MVNVQVFGYEDRHQTTGSVVKVSATVDGVDNTKARLWTTTTGSIYQNPPTSVFSGQQVSDVGGVQLPDQACVSITLKAFTDNTGSVFVGPSGVSSTNGFILLPDEAISMDIDNLNRNYIAVSNSGDGISYFGVI